MQWSDLEGAQIARACDVRGGGVAALRARAFVKHLFREESFNSGFSLNMTLTKERQLGIRGRNGPVRKLGIPFYGRRRAIALLPGEIGAAATAWARLGGQLWGSTSERWRKYGPEVRGGVAQDSAGTVVGRAVPLAVFDAQIRPRGVESCRLLRCSSKSEF